MAENKKTKIITCAICTKFCRNGDEEKLNDFIKRVKEERFEEIIFSCDFLKNYCKNNNLYGHNDS